MMDADLQLNGIKERWESLDEAEQKPYLENYFNICEQVEKTREAYEEMKTEATAGEECEQGEQSPRNRGKQSPRNLGKQLRQNLGKRVRPEHNIYVHDQADASGSEDEDENESGNQSDSSGFIDH